MLITLCLLPNLILVAKKSITQLRQLYFKMKDEIFGKVRHGGISFNTLGLEKLLKEEFTEHVCMDDESYPRYMDNGSFVLNFTARLVCYSSNFKGREYSGQDCGSLQT